MVYGNIVFLLIDLNSLSQSAFPFSKTGFFNKSRTVRICVFAMQAPSSVDLDYCICFSVSESFEKTDSFVMGDRFDIVRMFENSSVIVGPYFFFQLDAPRFFREVVNYSECISKSVIVSNFII